jgi:hypothetical protein
MWHKLLVCDKNFREEHVASVLKADTEDGDSVFLQSVFNPLKVEFLL